MKLYIKYRMTFTFGYLSRIEAKNEILDKAHRLVY